MRLPGQNNQIIISRSGVYLLKGNNITSLVGIEGLKKEVSGQNVELIVAEDVAHLNFVEYPKKELFSRYDLAKIISKSIPSNLDQLIWSYVLLNKKKQLYLTLALEKNTTGQFIKSIEKENYHVDSVSSLVYMIVSALNLQKTANLVIFMKDGLNFLSVNYPNGIISHTIQSSDNLKKEIGEFLNIVKERKGVDVEKLYVVADTDLSDLGLKTETLKFNWKDLEYEEIISSVHKQYPKDEDTTKPNHEVNVNGEMSENEVNQPTGRMKLLILALLLSLIAMSAVFAVQFVGN